MEAEIVSVSLSLFGTENYQSVLSVLPKYDGAVKEFKRQVILIRQKYKNREDD